MRVTMDLQSFIFSVSRSTDDDGCPDVDMLVFWKVDTLHLTRRWFR